MTDEQKQRKLAELDQFIAWAQTATPDQQTAAIRRAGFDLKEAAQLADNLRRQLAGEPPPASRAYHVSRRKPKS